MSNDIPGDEDNHAQRTMDVGRNKQTDRRTCVLVSLPVNQHAQPVF